MYLTRCCTKDTTEVMRNAKRKRGRLTQRHKSCPGNVKLDKLTEKGRNSASRVLSFFFFSFNSLSWDRHGTAAGSRLLKRQWLLHKHYISKQMDREGEGEEQCREEAKEKTGKKTQITATGSNSHPSRVFYVINNPLICSCLSLSLSLGRCIVLRFPFRVTNRFVRKVWDILLSRVEKKC